MPDDFISDTPKNRWWVIGQWHDQPNKHKSETWEDFPSYSPPIGLHLGELDGKIGIALSCGTTNDNKKQSIHGPIYFEKGQWQEIALHITWSQEHIGSIELFLNDMTAPALTVNGPNMNNAYQHYLKVGMYRHPEIHTDNEIFIDDLNVSKLP